MAEVWVAFITGLTTGGLSCMAVQGGLLASSLANQIEKDLVPTGKKQRGRFHIALPIALFLAAKLFIYSLAGALLGALGSVLQLTPVMRAVMQFAIGIFMVGNALRMFNVHPIFRFFSFEPPAFITRYIRRKAKNKTTLFTPLFLGLLTILIPCGVTQSIMAAAVAAGNPMQGAALLFAFTLGTSPVFFLLSYFATRLGSLLEKYFLRFTALVLLVLGLLAFDTGLNLAGAPYSLSRILQTASSDATLSNSTAQAAPLIKPAGVSLAGKESSVDEISLAVENSGYEPALLHAPANIPLRLNLVTNETYSCSRAFVIPELNIQELLPATGSVQVSLPAQPQGKVMAFSCSMGMYTGQIVYDR